MMITREEILNRNKKYRVSDKIKNKLKERYGLSFKINYSFEDECYYITFYDKQKHEEVYYVGIYFVMNNDKPFDLVVTSVMNNMFLRGLLDAWR